MRILIYLAVWKRPEITEICFMGIDRLRKAGIHSIEAFAVISEEEMKPLCDKWGVEYVMYKNEPLGEKKNFGLRQAMKKEFDYMMEIGSDDLLKTDILNLYPWNIDIMGLCSAIYINAATGDCKMLSGKVGVFGAGRAIRKSFLEKCGNIWDDRQNRSLDKRSMFRMSHFEHSDKRYSTPEPLVIDIKSETNIWRYRNVPGVAYPIERALQGLSDQEVTAIKSLYAVR